MGVRLEWIGAGKRKQHDEKGQQKSKQTDRIMKAGGRSLLICVHLPNLSCCTEKMFQHGTARAELNRIVCSAA